MQQDLNALHQWSILNCLSFHPSKCKFLPFNFECSQVLKLGETALDYTDYIEELDFTILSNLSWQRHIDTELAKGKKIFYFIKRKVPFRISAKKRLLLYQSLVFSILLYGCSVWQPSLTYMHMLEKSQSRVFRWTISDRTCVSAFQILSFLPMCYQKTKSNMVLLWIMINKETEVESDVQKNCFQYKFVDLLILTSISLVHTL